MLEYKQYDQLWEAHSDWMHQLPAQIIFSGNLKHGRLERNEHDFEYYESITQEKVESSVNYFIKKVSRRLFGTKQINNGKSLNYIGMIEGGRTSNRFGGPRYHVHIGISGIPFQCDLTLIANQMEDVWESGKWGYGHTLAEPCYGDRWIPYVLKNFSPMKTENFITNLPYREQ